MRSPDERAWRGGSIQQDEGDEDMLADDRTLHQGQPVLIRGELDRARAVMIMLHGRGSTAQSILELADALPHPDFAFVAPQAFGQTWYPHSFLMPIGANEPYLSSALRAVDDLVGDLIRRGFAAEQIMLLGFSQGACLALEYTARHARRYGGIVGLSGGLIGPDGTPRNYPGLLERTPIFLGCSTTDAHIPQQRVIETAHVLEEMDAEVTMRLYPGMGHTVNDDEIAFVRGMMRAVIDR
ncbi:MAG: alpha/beta hydrolase [Candidatus Flexifilum sp.]